MDDDHSAPVPNLNILDDIKVNLNILAQLKPGDKLVQRERHFDIDRWDYTQPLRRWYNSDSRTATINNLEQFVSMTFKYIDDIYSSESRDGTDSTAENSYYAKATKRQAGSQRTQNVFSDEHSSILLTLFSNLENANKGLGNLMRTYEADIAVCARIKVIIEQIEIRMSKIKGIMTIAGGTAPKDVAAFQGPAAPSSKEYVLRSSKASSAAPPPPPLKHHKPHVFIVIRFKTVQPVESLCIVLSCLLTDI
jgi:hypothetical protein